MTTTIVLTADCLIAGRRSFIDYQHYLACGQVYRRFEEGRFRATGPIMVPGAIYACIERGLSTGEEIIAATAKSTRCKHWTVSNILDELTGPGEEGYPF
jgi:hypothetical protein